MERSARAHERAKAKSNKRDLRVGKEKTEKEDYSILLKANMEIQHKEKLVLAPLHCSLGM